jgi:hypothetical protein
MPIASHAVFAAAKFESQPAKGRDGTSGYRFRNPGKVETLRFVELCKYYSEDESLRGTRLIDRMLPLDEWQPDVKRKSGLASGNHFKRSSCGSRI